MKKVMWLIICCLLIMCSTCFAETLAYQGGGKQYFIDETSVYYAGSRTEGNYETSEVHVVCRIYDERLCYSRRGTAKVVAEKNNQNNSTWGIFFIPEYDVLDSEGNVTKHIHDDMGGYFSDSPSNSEELGFFYMYIESLNEVVRQMKAILEK